MELGEERKLKFAMACADFIPQLQVFSESCKPVWLFLAEGDRLNESLSVFQLILLRRGCVGDGWT